MVFLNCFTLNGLKISDGIKADDYDCIVTADGSQSTIVRKASIKALPVVAADKLKLKDLAPLSLSFLYEAPEESEASNAGFVVSVKASEWGLATTDTTKCVLIAPGESGRVLLFINNGLKDALVYSKDRATVFGADLKAAPCVRKINRAALFASAALGSHDQKLLTVSM